MARFPRPVLLPDPRVAPWLAAGDDVLIARVLARWDHGLDTQAIAIELFEREASVVSALHVGLDRRRIKNGRQP